MNARNPSSYPEAHLFTVRLWVEDLGDGRTEYRGKVQHVVSGEALHFREWAVLEAFLQAELEAPGAPHKPTNRSS